jgi:hypothetical protein
MERSLARVKTREETDAMLFLLEDTPFCTFFVDRYS